MIKAELVKVGLQAPVDIPYWNAIKAILNRLRLRIEFWKYKVLNERIQKSSVREHDLGLLKNSTIKS